jgi:hypothetical protein
MPMPMPPFKGKAFPQPMAGGGAATLPFARKGEPVRMVVVHARFPMKQQMIEFQKALRMAQQDEMLQKNRDDLPKPLGLDIIRAEVLPGDQVKSEVLVGFIEVKDNKVSDSKTFHINKKLEELLRRSMYDERSPEVMKEYIWAGLTMPMPKLANRQYPKFDMPAFKLDWTNMEEEEKRPNLMAGGGIAAPGAGAREMMGKGSGFGGLPGFGKGRPTIEKKGPGMDQEPREPALEYVLRDMTEKDLKDSQPGLITRIFGGKGKRVEQDLNVFHVLGRHYPVADAVGGPNANPMYPNPNPSPRETFGPGMAGMAGGMANQDAYFQAWDVQEGGAQGAGVGQGYVPTTPGRQPGIKPPPVFNKGEKTPGGFGTTTAERFPDWDRDALVRFIDVDVKPGKTYKYWVRVRMANPNFNKTTKDVAYQELTIHAELPPSEWVETEAIPIPREYNLYAVDQQLIDDWDAGVAPKKGALPILKGEVLNSTPFQIHQWVESKNDSVNVGVGYVIGDWVIAEKKMVHRGEPIGRNLTVHAPAWFEKKDLFEVPHPPKVIGKKDPKTGPIKGMNIDLLPSGAKAPVLVDFAGGKRLTPQNALLEETAVEALVLFPDGTLRVLNSREASDPAQPAAKERIERLTRVRARIQEVQSADAPAAGGTLPGMPKGGGPPPFGGPGKNNNNN